MPMPTFYPSNYYNPYAVNYQPQPVQAQSQAAPVSQPSPGIIWIGSEKDAALYPVAPNNAVTLWNQFEPVVYLKQADASGKPTMKIYDLVERQETVQDARSSSDGKVSAYATKDELAGVASAVKDIDGIITSLSKEVDELKRSRKAARRREEEDDD